MHYSYSFSIEYLFLIKFMRASPYVYEARFSADLFHWKIERSLHKLFMLYYIHMHTFNIYILFLSSRNGWRLKEGNDCIKTVILKCKAHTILKIFWVSRATTPIYTRVYRIECNWFVSLSIFSKQTNWIVIPMGDSSFVKMKK